MDYISYNREERAICAHLFRLLHEQLSTNPTQGALYKILEIITQRPLLYKGMGKSLVNPGVLDYKSATIYTEVALIRDAYQARKPNIEPFMNKLVEIVKLQEGVEDCRLFSELPDEIKNPSKTHPKQIKQKADSRDIYLSSDERKVYGAIQGMFNAKPDLVIVVGDYLFVFEAKFTEKFDLEQLHRTWNISEVWASELLYEDLGFRCQPSYTVAKLGDITMDVDLSWNDVLEVASRIYGETDKSRIAFEKGVDLLRRMYRLP